MCSNAGAECREFTMPAVAYGMVWDQILDTEQYPSVNEKEIVVGAGERLWIRDRSLLVLQRAVDADR